MIEIYSWYVIPMKTIAVTQIAIYIIIMLKALNIYKNENLQVTLVLVCLADHRAGFWLVGLHSNHCPCK